MRVGDHRLDHLVRRQACPERLAFGGVLLRDLHGARGQADVAHAVKQARAFKAHLRILQPPAFLAHQGIGAHAALDQLDLGVAAARERLHGRDVAHDAKAGGIGVDQKPRYPAFAACHHDGKGSTNCTRNEPFVRIEYPAGITANPIAARGSQQHARVRAHARRRLGHGKARARFAARQRTEIAFALRRVGEAFEHGNIGLPGRRAIKCAGAEKAASDFLEKTATLLPRQAESA